MGTEREKRPKWRLAATPKFVRARDEAAGATTPPELELPQLAER